jgi:glycosyltransferase involved in cell wall biosynthesis
MKRPLRLVFVGHSHHRQTSSSRFFIELLEPHFDLQIIWNEDWKPEAPRLDAGAINGLEPDVVLFWQLLPRRSVLSQIRCARLVWAPMRDGVSLKPAPWQRLRPTGMRILSFCLELHEYAITQGLHSHLVRYWPVPTAAPATIVDDEPLRLLFWVRRAELGWPTLKALLGDARPERVLLRTVADPGQQLALPDAIDQARYRVEQVPDWLEPAGYRALLARSNVFVAPRMSEGIGMSFLEAMALGQAVIAPDRATMNEYVRDGINGWLYDPAAPRPLDFSRLAELRRGALAEVSCGRKHWEAQRAGLVDWLGDPAENDSSPWWRLRRRLSRI